MRERTVAFYDTDIRSLYRPGARLAIEQHRKSGDALVLLTSSSQYLGELVSAELKLDALVCTRFEPPDNGLHTAPTAGPLSPGPRTPPPPHQSPHPHPP